MLIMNELKIWKKKIWSDADQLVSECFMMKIKAENKNNKYENENNIQTIWRSTLRPTATNTGWTWLSIIVRTRTLALRTRTRLRFVATIGVWWARSFCVYVYFRVFFYYLNLI